MSDDFGRLLRLTRTTARVGLGELARYLGVSATFVSDVERGVRAPFTPDKILKAAERFNVSADPLLKAAATSKGFFLLRADVPERAKQVGAALMRRWAELSSDQIDDIGRIVDEEGQ